MAKVGAPKHLRHIRGPKGIRGGKKTRGMLVHTTEMGQRKGSGDRRDIINFLARKDISIPVVNDDEGSTIMTPLRYLGYGHGRGLTGKAWGIEQVGFAGWSAKEWKKHEEMVESTGRWAAWFLAEVMGLPVTMKNLKRFVVGHAQDHRLGGTSDHWDPGPNYPWGVMRAAAISYAAEKIPAGKPPKPKPGKPKPKVKMVTRYRIVAEKDDERLARNFRVNKAKQGFAWLRKQARRGYLVTIKRQTVKRADLD